MDHALLLAFAPWKTAAIADRSDLERALRSRLAPRPEQPWSAIRHGEAVLVDLVGGPALATALDVACRGSTWATAVMLRPPNQRRFQALHALERARRSPSGVAVRPDRADPRVEAVSGVIALYVALLRSRSPAAWTALDAARVHGSATAAAKTLGVTPQAVSKHLRRNHVRAVAHTPAVLTQLLRSQS